MADSRQSMHKVAVAGASGRMGHILIEEIRSSGDCQLAGALDIAASPAIGNDAAAFLGHASGVPVTADLRIGLASAKVLIDFTRPEGTLAHLKVCRELGVNAVIGTIVAATTAGVASLLLYADRHGATPLELVVLGLVLDPAEEGREEQRYDEEHERERAEPVDPVDAAGAEDIQLVVRRDRVVVDRAAIAHRHVGLHVSFKFAENLLIRFS